MMATEAGFGYSHEVIEQLWGLWRERSRAVGMRPYVAYLNGEPAGAGSIWPRGIFGWIDDVATHPHFRVRGVGRTMVFVGWKRARGGHFGWGWFISGLFD